MILFRRSLDATGHVQDANVFVTPFPDFPSDFSTAFCGLKAPNPKFSVVIYFLSLSFSFLPCMSICVRDREDKLEADCRLLSDQMLDGFKSCIFKQCTNTALDD